MSPAQLRVSETPNCARRPCVIACGLKYSGPTVSFTVRIVLMRRRGPVSIGLIIIAAVSHASVSLVLIPFGRCRKTAPERPNLTRIRTAQHLQWPLKFNE